jgi:outer membrane protein assembly factor BamB
MIVDSVRETIHRLGVRVDAGDIFLIGPQGAQQSWLIDLRAVFMQPDTLAQIAAAFWEKYKDREPFQLGGMETAAIPLLTALMLLAPPQRGKVNGFIIRKQRKTTGLGNLIEGMVTDEPVILVDDILNSGASAEKGRAAIAATGRTVREVFAVIDYHSRQGHQWRAKYHIAVQSLFTLDDFGLKLSNNPAPLAQQYKELWRTTVPGAFAFYVVPKSAPVLVNGKLYRGCDAGKMQAFDPDTGAVIWEYQTTGTVRWKGIWSSPAVVEGRLYFGAYNGCIYCLDAETGKEIWVRSLGEWVGASPLIVPRHGLVYFGIEYERPWAKGSIGAFDLKTGQQVWERLTKAFQHGSPAYWQGGDLIIWGTADHDMLALEASTGKVRWCFKTRRSVKYAPAISEDRGLVAFASFDKSIYVLDAQTGEKRGEWETGEICYTTPLFMENRLFCGSGDRNLYVIDLDNMELIQKIDLHGRVYASPVAVGNRVIVATAGGRVVEIDARSLEIRGEVQVPDAVTNAVAVSADGKRFFVSTYMNHLYGFERLDAPVVNAGLEESMPSTETSDGPQRTHANFKLFARRVDIAAIREEILGQPNAWLFDTVRQRTIQVQRHTESIFLRSALRSPNSTMPLEDVHPSQRTVLADRFPITMAWIEEFAKTMRTSVARALIAKLKPQAQVFRHVDEGSYYKYRDRYHLVLTSTSGSPMTCGEENVTMQEGELWWFDNKKPHESFNHSNEDRIHLIFDLDR